MSLANPRDAGALLALEGLDYLELPYNVLSPALPESVSTLHERGVTVLAHSVYGGGSLLRGDHLAVAFVLGQPSISSIALGAVTDAQMRYNIDLVARPALSAEHAMKVRELLR